MSSWLADLFGESRRFEGIIFSDLSAIDRPDDHETLVASLLVESVSRESEEHTNNSSYCSMIVPIRN